MFGIVLTLQGPLSFFSLILSFPSPSFLRYKVLLSSHHMPTPLQSPFLGMHSLAKISKRISFIDVWEIYLSWINLSFSWVRGGGRVKGEGGRGKGENVLTIGSRQTCSYFFGLFHIYSGFVLVFCMSSCCLRTGCDVTLNSDSGVVQSPAYGIQDYPNIVTCTWTIVSQSAILLAYDDSFGLINGDTLKVRELSLSNQQCLSTSCYSYCSWSQRLDLHLGSSVSLLFSSSMLPCCVVLSSFNPASVISLLHACFHLRFHRPLLFPGMSTSSHLCAPLSSSSHGRTTWVVFQ